MLAVSTKSAGALYWRNSPGTPTGKKYALLASVTDAYVSRLLPLTCLAPDIVEAILDGRQPKGLRLAEMLRNGPLSWKEQRVSLGSHLPARAAS